MRKTDTLHTKVGGEDTKVKVTYRVIESSHLTLEVSSQQEALLAAYHYRRSPSVNIEKAANGNWLVVIEKN